MDPAADALLSPTTKDAMVSPYNGYSPIPIDVSYNNANSNASSCDTRQLIVTETPLAEQGQTEQVSMRPVELHLLRHKILLAIADISAEHRSCFCYISQ